MGPERGAEVRGEGANKGGNGHERGQGYGARDGKGQIKGEIVKRGQGYGARDGEGQR